MTCRDVIAAFAPCRCEAGFGRFDMSDAATALQTDAPQEADAVLDLETFAMVAGVSSRTLKREIAAGRGPRITRPSPRRVGVRLSHGMAWLNDRED